MVEKASEVRSVRYSPLGVLALVGAGALALVSVGIALFGGMLMIPLVPVFVLIVFGAASLLSSALAYAKSSARGVERRARLVPRVDAPVEARARAAVHV